MARKKLQRNITRARKRILDPIRGAGAAGVGLSTAMMAGAAAMLLTAPPSSADTPTAASSLDPVIDQILANMQQVVTTDEALPFATASSDATLLTSVQNTNYELLMSLVSADTLGVSGFFQSPEAVAGDAANSREFFQFFTPDIYYRVAAGLDPQSTYQLTGTVGGGTEGLSISLEQLGSGSASAADSSLQLDSNLVVNPDGTFTVDIGPTEPSGAVNYIDDAGGSGLLIRDVLGNWAQGPGSLSIQCVADCPPANPDITPAGLDSAGISELLNQLSANIIPFNGLSIEDAIASGATLPANTMTSLAPETGFGSGLDTALVSSGHFDLQPDQALIVEVPNIDAGYSGIELLNSMGAALPYTLDQTTLNNTQAFADPDGFTYYVVSATNPGVANWLDSGNVTDGDIFARFENVTDGASATGLGVTTQVVPLADVSQYLPSDTPTVSPTQYAADLSERVFSYDYALDSARETSQPSWVTQELSLYDLQSALGTQNFDAIFGSEPSTPLWLRLTPALSPNWDTVAKDFFTNPTGSFEALQNNLQLAESDISLPTTLAETLVQQDFSSTSEAVQTALSSNQPLEALTALESGGQQLGSILDSALFDPNTGIIAGMLNARDDLATAVLTANGGFPSEASPLATLEWDYMSQLTSSTSLAGLATQLSPDALASDLAELSQNLSTLAPGLSSLVADLGMMINPADFTP